MTIIVRKLLISTIIKSIIIVLLIAAAFGQQEYSYYNLLRWCLTGSSTYFIYTSITKKETGLAIYFSVLTILFNPFKKVWFNKETWLIFNYVVIIMLVLTIVQELYQIKIIENEKN